MEIRMTGIDYQKAPVELRELFAMTAHAAAEAARQVCDTYGASGCVVLSTCNRTELWISGETQFSPYEILCRLKQADAGQYRDRFVSRAGKGAVRHLFLLACGLKSQVFGEDQIITQVGNALALAREEKAADPVLENLFRGAVTAAKKVKTNIRLTASDRSVAVCTGELLQQTLGSLADVPCLVIGNGEMGRLAAEELVRLGAQVWMTVRQYRHGEVVVPPGVQTAPYAQRMELLPQMRVVVSATASPHETIRADEVGALPHRVVFCDLAMPRDIDPAIASIAGARLFHTDQICAGSAGRVDEEMLEQAYVILEECIGEFESWYGFRSLVPVVQEISGLAAEDLSGRLEKPMRKLALDAGQQREVIGVVHDAAGKVVGRMLFGLRENLDPDLWQSCIEGLQKSARKESLV